MARARDISAWYNMLSFYIIRSRSLICKMINHVLAISSLLPSVRLLTARVPAIGRWNRNRLQV